MADSSVSPSDRLVRLGHAFREAKVLLSAVELGVFTVLAEGPLDLESLRGRIDIDRCGARDFFDAPVALGLLERHENGRYTNTPETSFHLDSRTQNYIGAELDYLNTQIYAQSSSLTRRCAPESHRAAQEPRATIPADIPIRRPGKRS